MNRLVHLVRAITLFGAPIISFLFLASSPMAAAQTSGRVTPCRFSAITESLSTNAQRYAIGTSVKMNVTIRNDSSRSCTISVGPTSPSLVILNSKGNVVWNNCYAGDQPGACAMFLMLRTLKPSGSYSLTKSWNQRDGTQQKFVPRGDYVLTSNVSGIGTERKVDFTLVA